MRDGPDALMIFAAGFGTRMGPLVEDRPKPLVEVAGRPLIDHALGLTEGHPVARVAVNTHHRSDQMARHLADRPVMISRETPDILDTGGGLRAALPLLGRGPVFTLNSDACWRGPNPLSTLAAAWEPGRMEALLLLVPLDRARGNERARGDFTRGEDGQLIRGGPLRYTGAQIVATERVAQMDDRAFSLNRIWDAAAAAGGLYGAVYGGAWCDVGSPEGVAAAEAMLAHA